MMRRSAAALLAVMLMASLAVGACSSGSAETQGPRQKTIGIIGGVSWQSSIEYYRLLNQMVGDELGGLHSAKILMYSI